ncbi:hypothetical protein HDF24_08830 [Mucilaginibacter sp. X4EP1]|uniref:hypothetical protein n=1 Tax=Mucilaginibacter sp. X4EP1 TaxID=2723092 RepID=UPI002168A87E|nr:hypothetical protein [Mucilaginibacter sp. X4EP1]MCS3813774.1 hypothetical protein [Mucilaginibacter sp. X4EP1]
MTEPIILVLIAAFSGLIFLCYKEPIKAISLLVYLIKGILAIGTVFVIWQSSRNFGMLDMQEVALDGVTSSDKKYILAQKLLHDNSTYLFIALGITYGLALSLYLLKFLAYFFYKQDDKNKSVSDDINQPVN